MKKNKKNVVAEDLWNIDELLEHNNNFVLEYFDGMVNDEERKKKINEVIIYLNDCLLDRDAGNTGPKLIDELNERVKVLQTSIKEYGVEELIWWKGTEGQLIYLYERLVKNNFIDSSQDEKKYVLLANHFKNKRGDRFNNKQMGQAAQNLVANKTRKPKDSNKIDEIIENTHPIE